MKFGKIEIKMKASGIKTLDRMFLFFLFLIALYGGGLFLYNFIYIQSNQLSNQSFIFIVIAILGFALYIRHRN